MRLVILGGSFNPPTKAHKALLRAGMAAVNAQRGIFLPASCKYFTSDKEKTLQPHQILPDYLRIRMLDGLRDADMTIDEYECDTRSNAQTYLSLMRIQKDCPDARLYFIVGSDKLHILPRWHSIEPLMAQFHILVATRAQGDAEKLMAQSPFYARHADRFTVFTVPGHMEHISSTALRHLVRADMSDADRALAADHLGSRENLSLLERAYFRRIDRFRDEFAFLSNFYAAPVTFDGLTYANSEAAFQAQKTLLPEARRAFTDCPARQAKLLGRQVALREDWRAVRDGLMLKIVRCKFTQDPQLAAQLLQTGDALLEEGNTWHDVYWGVCKGQGKNRLGSILMQVREELSLRRGSGPDAGQEAQRLGIQNPSGSADADAMKGL